MSNTSNLQLPYLAVGQAQKHVTVNQSLRRLDAVIQLSVVSATTPVEPSSPTDGDVYIVPSGKSGANWAPLANWSLAYFRDGAWEELSPREGWLAYVKDAGILLHYSDASWALFDAGSLVSVSGTDKLLGRSTSGAGSAEEIPCTAAGRALLDAADVSTQRSTLGLGSAALKNIGVSGDAVPVLNGAATTWAGNMTVDNTAPSFRLYENDGPTDERRWRWQASDGTLTLAAHNDAQSAFGAPIQITRTGATIDEIKLSATALDFHGDLVLSGAAIIGGAPRPAADNTLALGSASFRWSEVFAGAGAINTSDARFKTDLRPPSPQERRAIRRVMSVVGVYRWRDAIASKGEGARLHCGVTAQAVADAFAAEGLDPARYALFCKDEVEGGQRLGLRYDQLFAMALAALFGS